jgi:hypothetical protein
MSTSEYFSTTVDFDPKTWVPPVPDPLAEIRRLRGIIRTIAENTPNTLVIRNETHRELRRVEHVRTVLRANPTVRKLSNKRRKRALCETIK